MPCRPSSPMTPPQSVLSRSSTRHLRALPFSAARTRQTWSACRGPTSSENGNLALCQPRGSCQRSSPYCAATNATSTSTSPDPTTSCAMRRLKLSIIARGVPPTRMSKLPNSASVGAGIVWNIAVAPRTLRMPSRKICILRDGGINRCRGRVVQLHPRQSQRLRIERYQHCIDLGRERGEPGSNTDCMTWPYSARTVVNSRPCRNGAATQRVRQVIKCMGADKSQRQWRETRLLKRTGCIGAPTSRNDEAGQYPLPSRRGGARPHIDCFGAFDVLGDRPEFGWRRNQPGKDIRSAGHYQSGVLAQITPTIRLRS